MVLKKFYLNYGYFVFTVSVDNIFALHYDCVTLRKLSNHLIVFSLQLFFIVFSSTFYYNIKFLMLWAALINSHICFSLLYYTWLHQQRDQSGDGRVLNGLRSVHSVP